MSGQGVTFGVRQSDLARRWSVSRQTVSRYVAEGMPLDTVEMAEAWRLQVKGKGPMPAGKCGGISAFNNCSTDGEGAPPVVSDEGLGDLLRRVCETERTCWGDLQDALIQGGSAELRTQLLRQHKDAAAVRLKVQQECIEMDMKAGRLVTMEDAKAYCRHVLAPLAVGLRSLGGKVAVKANPGRPETAQKAVEEEVQRLLRGFAEGLAS